MASKINQIVAVLIIFVCCKLQSTAQENNSKIPDHIHKMFIEFDTCLTIDKFKNIERYKSLFHKNVVDTISIIHDLYYTGLKYGFKAKSPIKIEELNQLFNSGDETYSTNIRNSFLKFGERVTLQSRYGYKLYQYRLNKLLYYEKNDNNDFIEIPYYISLLSYNDPNNSTLKRASIIKVSNTKIIYPNRFKPESIALVFKQGIGSNEKKSGISNLNYQSFNVQSNFLLTGKKYFAYYLQLGAGYLNYDFNASLANFSETFDGLDTDGSKFQKHAKYEGLSQVTQLRFIEIPFAFKAQHYRKKNVINFFASAGFSYYIPKNLTFTNTQGSVDYYGSYRFGNNFTIDLKDLPEYGFSKYQAKPTEKKYSTKSLYSVNTTAGINLRVNNKISVDAGFGFKYFLKDICIKQSSSILSSGEGIIEPLIQKMPVDLSMASIDFGLTYNISPIRSPYYPIIDKRLLNLKGNRINQRNLTSEKIKLSPSSSFIMKNLKTIEYQFKVNNESVLKQGKISKKSGNYYIKVNIPKDQSHLELVKQINYNFWSGDTEVINEDPLLPIDLKNNNDIKISKIPDLDIVVLFKFSNAHPDDKFALYDNMSKKVSSICSASSENERIIFANDTIHVFKPEVKCDSAISAYLIDIQNQLTITDMSLVSDFSASLRNNRIVSKRRNINLHIFYLYKDMVFNTNEQSTEFLQMYSDKVELISKLEKEMFGNQFNNIKVNIWSNFTPSEVDLLNRFTSINQINWKYKIY